MLHKQIIDFIEYLKIEREYALNTRLAYQTDLQKLLDFMQQNSINSWSNLTTEHLNLLIMNMRHSNICARSISRQLSAVRGFLKYLLSQNIVANNCALSLKTPKLDKNLPKTLDYEQLLQLLKRRSERLSEFRDVAIVEVVYSCGLRVAELVGLNVADVDIHQGFLRVMGKGDKMRDTPLGAKAQQAIVDYLQKSQIRQGALFVNNKQQRISARAVQNMVKKRALEVGIKINLHPHILRHAAATDFLRSSHDLRSVQEFLGHKSIKSTQIYTHLDFLELSKVYDKCHPRAKKKS